MYRCLNPYLGQILNQIRNRKGKPLEHCRFSIPDGEFFVSVKSRASLIERYNRDAGQSKGIRRGKIE